GKLSKQLIDSFSSMIIISGLGHQGMYKFAGDALSDDKKKKYIIDFLKYGDIGIEDVKAIEISSDDLPDDIDDDIRKDFDNKKKRKLLVSTRKKYDKILISNDTESLSFGTHESEGTQILFELSPFIFKALKNKRPIIIDEFNAR